MVGPSRRRQAVEHVRTTVDVPERRACSTLHQPRSTQRYRSRRPPDETRLVRAMLDLVRKYPRYGSPRIHRLLVENGWRVNHKRIERLWKREGLRVPRKARKKRRLGHSAHSCAHYRARGPNHVWAWDFIHDRLVGGRPMKWLTLIDEFTRECLALRPARSIRSRDAIGVLAEVIRQRGAPQFVRSDNGPEFIARAMGDWLAEAKIGTLYIEPGAPWENGYAESFHSRLRDELLNTEEFTSHAEAQVIAKEWKHNYNHRRPHSALGYLTPAGFAVSVKVGKVKKVRGKGGQALLSLESEMGNDQEKLSLGVVRKKG